MGFLETYCTIVSELFTLNFFLYVFDPMIVFDAETHSTTLFSFHFCTFLAFPNNFLPAQILGLSKTQLGSTSTPIAWFTFYNVIIKSWFASW